MPVKELASNSTVNLLSSHQISSRTTGFECGGTLYHHLQVAKGILNQSSIKKLCEKNNRCRNPNPNEEGSMLAEMILISANRRAIKPRRRILFAFRGSHCTALASPTSYGTSTAFLSFTNTQGVWELPLQLIHPMENRKMNTPPGHPAQNPPVTPELEFRNGDLRRSSCPGSSFAQLPDKRSGKTGQVPFDGRGTSVFVLGARLIRD
ncbi:hypothetical protein CEXT_775001 [Caerostris extrusa]|uniref:Uncharacterized protein n=1 Tax=Caerostris extrusa TaxID=172846 RepID=A0AAV4RKA2_CAEEX|nr:hypothetical protein CEXT_775001 [Caerostris extrusa]